jgi:uncharacterized phage-like protein YoqJ
MKIKGGRDMKSACFTGHRNLGSDLNRGRLVRCIEKAISKGCDTFICGGALGFDTYAAEEIIKLKKSHPEIELHLYLPCKDQEARWSERDKEKYYEILKCADYVDCPDTPYYDGCMRARNYKMVDNSSLCISYLKDNVKSGTAQTVRYACQNGLFLCNLSTSKDSCFFEIKEKYFR